MTENKGDTLFGIKPMGCEDLRARTLTMEMVEEANNVLLEAMRKPPEEPMLVLSHAQIELYKKLGLIK